MTEVGDRKKRLQTAADAQCSKYDSFLKSSSKYDELKMAFYEATELAASDGHINETGKIILISNFVQNLGYVKKQHVQCTRKDFLPGIRTKKICKTSVKFSPRVLIKRNF